MHQQQAGVGNLRRLQKGGSRPTSAAGVATGAPAPAGAEAQQSPPQGRRQQLEAAQERLRRREEARRRAARFVDCEAQLSGDDASGMLLLLGLPWAWRGTWH